MEILDFLTEPAPTLDELLTMVLRTGELNYRIMQVLDRQTPTPSGTRSRPAYGCILAKGRPLPSPGTTWPIFMSC